MSDTELSSESVSRRLYYEPSSGNFIRKVKANAIPAGSVAGSVTKNGYVEIHILGRRVLAHRLAWLITHGEWPAFQIDHKNGVRHDNRISNLREASNAQNQANQPIRRTNKSGFKGVSFDRLTGKWRADISIGGKGRYLGSFRDIEDAAKAAAKAREKYHGEFANHG